ncbi:uncharacterized protein Z519_06285 [Cladophialophora bantiana CBS 173.52]|uniref:Uncharacterized protein n=1 Tax=Cladophialophora bantiana (strain ATCC 10958 / CBS 173.52 / CDC B-1940 / NIH 8579) TaxID=1442370 RepID=A0A0D2HS30_CLAB1|nr:uncharacterized protein Z519_06285 [Cladophialophora bantiana CBS 173.52]KIW93680.1 hypothetical protein Z519_06285 [Cladophialophora bantiana CBS 173.52]
MAVNKYQRRMLRSVEIDLSSDHSKEGVLSDQGQRSVRKLIQKVAVLPGKPNDLVPSSKGLLERMKEEDLKRSIVFHVGTNCAAAERIGGQMFPRFAGSFLDDRCQERILELLGFRTMDERRELISAPERGTYNWALETPSPDDGRPLSRASYRPRGVLDFWKTRFRKEHVDEKCGTPINERMTYCCKDGLEN